MGLHSSWNSDRVAACCRNKSAARRTSARSRLIAQHRGNEVTLLGPCGGKRGTWMMKVAVSSAIVRDGRLAVETVDGSKYEYDVETKKLLSENAPVAGKTEVILALPTEPRDLAAA